MLALQNRDRKCYAIEPRDCLAGLQEVQVSGEALGYQVLDTILPTTTFTLDHNFPLRWGVSPLTLRSACLEALGRSGTTPSALLLHQFPSLGLLKRFPLG